MNQYCRQLVEDAVDELFKYETNRYIEQLDALIDANNKANGCYSNGINYCGKKYGRGGRVIGWGAASLHRDLIPKMAELVKFIDQVELDKRIIIQGLTKLTHKLESVSDLRDALPECLVKCHYYLKTLPRTREPAWNVQDDPRELENYQKTLTRIEAYIAMRLLY